MDKKLIIKIAVIVLSFGGSGLILYNGFNNKAPDGLPVSLSPSAAISQGIQELLPHGKELNFSPVDRSRFQFDVIEFPQLNTNEVGIQPEELIAPLETVLP